MHRIGKEIRSVASSLLNRFAPDTPVYSKIVNINDLVDANEYGIAFEILCEHIYEFDVHLNQEELLTLKALGDELPNMQW